jgi:hypothetical protein
VTDAVPDDQGYAPVVEVDDVVPIATDLQRAAGRVISHRKAPGR